jgi:glycosyltransferase involved in cell wall biosynthesis
MKILQVNKFLYPKGGADKYFLELSAQLAKNGQQVRFFAMADPRNLPWPDSKYFVSNISFADHSLKNSWRSLGRTLYSREAKNKFAALLQDFRPDIIHLHNIYHQLSPSIITAARQAKIPVVMHLHDYKLICPNFKLFSQGQVCERCRPDKYYNCLRYRCLDNSLLKSSGAVLEMYLHHKILKIYETGVELFIAPSQFMKKTVEDFGWPPAKIRFLPNFFSPEFQTRAAQPSHQDYLLYFGRLAEEKGVATLLQAVKLSGDRLKIAGVGNQESALKALAAKLSISGQVEFLGQQTGEDLLNLIQGARAVVIPSIWLENMPLNLLEALALGQIVIAADIGGLPEIITAGENGFLFRPGEPADLAQKIADLRKADRPRLSRAAQATVRDLNIVQHTKQIEEIYREIINNYPYAPNSSGGSLN